MADTARLQPLLDCLVFAGLLEFRDGRYSNSKVASSWMVQEPPMVLGLNLYLANVLDSGRGYTENKHREWLGSAGFHDVLRVMTGRFDGSSAIIATKSRR